VRRAARRLACAASLLALAGCTIEREREQVLPWLLREDIYTAFGSFGGSTNSTYYTRHWGFWRGLDVWDASVLDAEHALVSDAEGTGVLREGSLTPFRVCPQPYATPSVPPIDDAVDCAEAVGHSHLGIVKVRARRLDYAGELRSEWTLDAPGERRIFHPYAQVLAYDAEGVPYFVVMDAEAARDYRIQPRDCALVAPGPDGGTRVVPGPAQMTWEECFRPAHWSVVLERPLRAATRRASRRPLNAEPGRADPASR
jgi:hypothetical protein